MAVGEMPPISLNGVRRNGNSLAVFHVHTQMSYPVAELTSTKDRSCPVRRPGNWAAEVLAAGQFLHAATAVRFLPVNTQWPVLVRGEGYSVPSGAHTGAFVRGTLKRKPGHRIPCQFVHPDLVIPAHYYLAAIGRRMCGKL